MQSQGMKSEGPVPQGDGSGSLEQELGNVMYEQLLDENELLKKEIAELKRQEEVRSESQRLKEEIEGLKRKLENQEIKSVNSWSEVGVEGSQSSQPPPKTPRVGRQGKDSDETRFTPSGTQIPLAYLLPAWPPWLSPVEEYHSVEESFRGGRIGDVTPRWMKKIDAPTPEQARMMWLEREVETFRKVIRAQASGGWEAAYWSQPVHRWPHVAENQDLCHQGRAPTEHPDLCHQGRAGTEHPDLCHQGRASTEHPDLCHQGRASTEHPDLCHQVGLALSILIYVIKVEHPDLCHQGRASTEHPDLCHQGRASTENPDLCHQGWASTEHPDLCHQGRAGTEHPDLRHQGRAVTEHPDLCHQSRAGTEHPDLRHQGRAGTEHHGLFHQGRAASGQPELPHGDRAREETTPGGLPSGGGIEGGALCHGKGHGQGLCAGQDQGHDQERNRVPQYPGGEQSGQGSKLELPALPRETTPMDLGDWLTLITPSMKDIANNASFWWECTLAEATRFYEQWRQSTPLQRVQLKPVLPMELTARQFERTEQRGVGLLLRALPTEMRNVIISNRDMASTAILWRLLITYQPGGNGEKGQLLKVLTTSSSVSSASQLASYLRQWRRCFTRTREIGACVPDGTLMVYALGSSALALGKLDGQAAFRIASSRAQLGVDEKPEAEDSPPLLTGALGGS